jgi:hypothetical protein
VNRGEDGIPLARDRILWAQRPDPRDARDRGGGSRGVRAADGDPRLTWDDLAEGAPVGDQRRPQVVGDTLAPVRDDEELRRRRGIDVGAEILRL